MSSKSAILILLISTVYAESPYRPKSTSGVYCKPRFDYGGKSYQDCTTEGSTKPWCYIIDQEWDYCEAPPDFSKCEVLSPSINSTDIDTILQLLNNIRSKEPALRMAKIKWNLELAMRAEFMSSLCKLGNDNNKLCSSKTSMGQISYMTMSSVPQSSQWMQFLLEFYKGRDSYLYDTNQCTATYCNGYKQMVNAVTTSVGCAKTACIQDSLYADYYFCNFYPPIYSGKPYEKGTGKCDSCFRLDDTKKFRCTDGLCEICDSPDADCKGNEILVEQIASGKICEDLNPKFCKPNESMCQYLGLLPASQKDYLTTQCKKTCKLC